MLSSRSPQHTTDEKNPITKKAIEDRVAGYMKRAEDIKKFIDPHKDMSTTNATSTGIVSGEGTSAFLSQAVGIIKDAIEADNNAEYEKAYALYKQALERFLLAIKCASIFCFLVFFDAFVADSDYSFIQQQMRQIPQKEN